MEIMTWLVWNVYLSALNILSHRLGALVFVMAGSILVLCTSVFHSWGSTASSLQLLEAGYLYSSKVEECKLFVLMESRLTFLYSVHAMWLHHALLLCARSLEAGPMQIAAVSLLRASDRSPASARSMASCDPRYWQWVSQARWWDANISIFVAVVGSIPKRGQTKRPKRLEHCRITSHGISSPPTGLPALAPLPVLPPTWGPARNSSVVFKVKHQYPQESFRIGRKGPCLLAPFQSEKKNVSHVLSSVDIISVHLVSVLLTPVLTNPKYSHASVNSSISGAKGGKGSSSMARTKFFAHRHCNLATQLSKQMNLNDLSCLTLNQVVERKVCGFALQSNFKKGINHNYSQWAKITMKCISSLCQSLQVGHQRTFWSPCLTCSALGPKKASENQMQYSWQVHPGNSLLSMISQDCVDPQFSTLDAQVMSCSHEFAKYICWKEPTSVTYMQVTCILAWALFEDFWKQQFIHVFHVLNFHYRPVQCQDLRLSCLPGCPAGASGLGCWYVSFAWHSSAAWCCWLDSK